jgi:hypothetical protein
LKNCIQGHVKNELHITFWGQLNHNKRNKKKKGINCIKLIQEAEMMWGIWDEANTGLY